MYCYLLVQLQECPTVIVGGGAAMHMKFDFNNFVTKCRYCSDL